jgi:uncharacterized membrane protein (UPF0127 family)
MRGEYAYQQNVGGAARRAALSCFAVVVMLAISTSLAFAQATAMRRDTLVLVTAAGEKTIDIEVADTPEQKSLGLMFRTSLADHAGMLFPYSPPQEIAMWMKNTFISLDMVFIRADGIVHRIAVRTEPLSERTIASNGPVSGVLELAGGAAERLGLKVGDRVRHAHFAGLKR